MMDETPGNDELDQLIRRAMNQRPVHTLGFNLAEVALRRGRSAPSHAPLKMVARVNRLNQLATMVAMVLIVCLSAWMLRSRITAGGFSYWSSTTTETSATTSTTATDASTTSSEWMLAGAALSIGALVVVLCQRAMSPGNDEGMGWRLETIQLG